MTSRRMVAAVVLGGSAVVVGLEVSPWPPLLVLVLVLVLVSALLLTAQRGLPALAAAISRASCGQPGTWPPAPGGRRLLQIPSCVVVVLFLPFLSLLASLCSFPELSLPCCD